MSVIPAIEILRQEDCEFHANLVYIARPCCKKCIFFAKNVDKNALGLKLVTRQ
jgi:hypothetical protein